MSELGKLNDLGRGLVSREHAHAFHSAWMSDLLSIDACMVSAVSPIPSPRSLTAAHLCEYQRPVTVREKVGKERVSVSAFWRIAAYGRSRCFERLVASVQKEERELSIHTSKPSGTLRRPSTVAIISAACLDGWLTVVVCRRLVFW